MLQFLGSPEQGLRFVHVAGSKGKGSTSAMIASIAKAAGLRAGLYTQPHLHSFAERIMVDLTPIDRLVFARLVGRVGDAVDWLTEHHADLGGGDSRGGRRSAELPSSVARQAHSGPGRAGA